MFIRNQLKLTTQHQYVHVSENVIKNGHKFKTFSRNQLNFGTLSTKF